MCFICSCDPVSESQDGGKSQINLSSSRTPQEQSAAIIRLMLMHSYPSFFSASRVCRSFCPTLEPGSKLRKKRGGGNQCLLLTHSCRSRKSCRRSKGRHMLNRTEFPLNNKTRTRGESVLLFLLIKNTRHKNRHLTCESVLFSAATRKTGIVRGCSTSCCSRLCSLFPSLHHRHHQSLLIEGLFRASLKHQEEDEDAKGGNLDSSRPLNPRFPAVVAT